MNEQIKQWIRRSPFYYPVRNWLTRRSGRRELVEWEKAGRPVPPPDVVKGEVLRRYARQHGLRVLVETGTCFGHMVEAMKKDFDRIVSIELSDELFETARRRFQGVDHISILHGDSATELAAVVQSLDGPALFWLDGHYSAGVTARGASDTPIREELHHVLTAPNDGHIIVIDDARCFGADPAYPTVEDIARFVRARRPLAKIVVEDDSIRITPGAAHV